MKLKEGAHVAHPDNIYHERVVRLCELAGDDAILERFEFTGCQVKGPAVLILQASQPGSMRLERNSFEGDMDAVLWEVNTQARPQVIGAILCVDCVFEDCTFTKVGFAGPPEFIQMFRGGTEVR